VFATLYYELMLMKYWHVVSSNAHPLSFTTHVVPLSNSTYVIIIYRAAAASENAVENGLRGSDSVTRELRKNGGGAQTKDWSCETVNTDPVDTFPDCNVLAGKQWVTSGETKGTPDTCKACCECDDNVDGNIVDQRDLYRCLQLGATTLSRA
jgi:hypothetical protein